MTDMALLATLDPCRSAALPIDVDAGLSGFTEPWHAQAFGTAMAVARAGLFDWSQWVEAFSHEIRARPQREEESSEAAYYRQWLDALESLVAGTGAVAPAEIVETAEHWRRSYLHTPHGEPIAFSREFEAIGHDDDDDHDLDDHHHHSGGGGPLPAPVRIDPPIRTA